MTRWTSGVLAIACGFALAGCGPGKSPPPAKGPAPLKIGFLVKQPEEPWFQYEWKFGDKAAKDLGFELVKIGIGDGEKTLAAIDNLIAGGAKGYVICVPDVRLGPAIVAKSRAADLKFICVDDAFVGADGQIMKDVPYYGMSASKIGHQVGEVLLAEMKRRGWSFEEVGAMVVSHDELDTIRQRTDGAIAALTEGGFPAARIFKAPTQKLEIPAAMDAGAALLTQKADIKKWIICGGNDNSVLGGVRATEQHQLAPEQVIGVGINGTDCQAEFAKDKATGFYASILPEVWSHGYETAKLVYEWVKDGKAPPLDTRTAGVMINRDNFRQVLKEKGIAD